MKRLFTFLALVTAFVGNAMAQSYEPKLDESYTFTDYGDNANVVTISQDGITCLRSIGNSGHLSFFNLIAYPEAPEPIQVFLMLLLSSVRDALTKKTAFLTRISSDFA